MCVIDSSAPSDRIAKGEEKATNRVEVDPEIQISIG